MTSANGLLTLHIIVRCQLRVLSGEEIYQCSKVPTTLLQGKLCKSWCDSSYQFFSLSTTFSIRPVFSVLIKSPLPYYASNSSSGKPKAAACFASLSASSSLLTSLWPVTHSNLTQLCIERSVRAFMVSRTNCDVVLATAKVLSVVWLSEHSLHHTNIIRKYAYVCYALSTDLHYRCLDDPSIVQPESTGLCSSIDSAVRSIVACTNNRSLDGTAWSINSADRSIARNIYTNAYSIHLCLKDSSILPKW